MGRSISAPPPGLVEAVHRTIFQVLFLKLTSSTPDLNQDDKTNTREYYYYYHSLKPHDPRLPKPTWKPVFYGNY
jgi:hypothetical protein